MGKHSGRGRAPYREALAALGWYFDRQQYRGIFVAEADDGYVGKARPAEEEAERHAEGLSFPRSDVQALMAAADASTETPAETSPLCPTGYGPFMSAVGELYDRNDARQVSLLEVTNGFVLGFTARGENGRGLERQRVLLDRAGVLDLLHRAGV